MEVKTKLEFRKEVCQGSFTLLQGRRPRRPPHGLWLHRGGPGFRHCGSHQPPQFIGRRRPLIYRLRGVRTIHYYQHAFIT